MASILGGIMQLKEAIRKLDKSESNAGYVAISDLYEELGIGVVDIPEHHNIRAYWLKCWKQEGYCIGTKILFLGEKPVAIAEVESIYEKDSYSWFSFETMNEVRNYLLTILPDKTYAELHLCSLDTEIEESFKLERYQQVTNWEKATYKGENIVIAERILQHPDLETDCAVQIELKNGSVKRVDIKDLEFSINLQN